MGHPNFCAQSWTSQLTIVMEGQRLFVFNMTILEDLKEAVFAQQSEGRITSATAFLAQGTIDRADVHFGNVRE